MHAKNSEKVRAQKRERVFKTILTQQKKEDDGNTRLEFREGTCNDPEGCNDPRKRRRRL